MEEIMKKLREFNNSRDWSQFHTPENLAKSIAIEAGELLECFQWGSEYRLESVQEELADVMMYCLMLADRTEINLEEAMHNKIIKNEQKYPIEKAKGNSRKYTEFEE